MAPKLLWIDLSVSGEPLGPLPAFVDACQIVHASRDDLNEDQNATNSWIQSAWKSETRVSVSLICSKPLFSSDSTAALRRESTFRVPGSDFHL